MGADVNAVRILLIASLGALSLGSAAVAADAPMMVDEQAIAMATSNWDGFYLGGGGYVLASSSVPGENYAGVRVTAGANITKEGWLFGGEVYGGVERRFAPAASAPYGVIGGEVRAGALVTDTVLLYGAIGAEAIPEFAQYYLTAGGGIEVMVVDQVSLDLEYKYVVRTDGGFTGHQVGVSANWHF